MKELSDEDLKELLIDAIIAAATKQNTTELLCDLVEATILTGRVPGAADNPKA